MFRSLPVKPETVIVIAAFFALLLLETLAPLRRPKRARGPRFLVNLIVTALSFGVGMAVVRPVALFFVAAWSEAHTFGLLPWSASLSGSRPRWGFCGWMSPSTGGTG